jgi:cytoskeletal protein RodZ
MKLTGQKLKEKRDALRLTISEVSLATKINPKVLVAMENGDLENLPATTFLRGFVRSYAGYLKMNVGEALTLFNQEIGEAGKKETMQPVVLEKHHGSGAPVDVNGEGSGTFRALIVGCILLLILLIIGVRGLIQKYERERSVETSTDIVAPLDDKKPVPTPTATPSPDATPEPTPTPTPTPTASPAPTATPTPAASSTPTVEVKIIPPEPVAPAVVPPPAPPVEVKAEKPSAPEPVPEKPAENRGHKHEIVLEALDSVEVKFKLHGKDEKIRLAPNQVHTIFSDGPLTLDVSDGGALNIIDNGRDKGPPGDLGHPKQVNIP